MNSGTKRPVFYCKYNMLINIRYLYGILISTVISKTFSVSPLEKVALIFLGFGAYEKTSSVVLVLFVNLAQQSDTLVLASIKNRP